MRILSAQEIRDWDAFTIQNEPISSIDLMERAATAALNNIPKPLLSQPKIVFLCGSGNNGGDGLAMARLFFQGKSDSTPEVYLINSKTYSEDNETNQARLKEIGLKIAPLEDFLENNYGQETLIIDCLLGTGFSGPLRNGILKATLDKVNALPCTTVSIDIPSGIDSSADSLDKSAIQADLTISFEAIKLPFILPEYEAHIGEWKVVSIGLHADKAFYSNRYYLTQNELPPIKNRLKHSHKGKHGHALFVTGESEMIGASILACKSALHTGLGLLTSWQPGENKNDLQVAIPEAMSLFESEITKGHFTAIAIGPGLGTAPLSLEKLTKTIAQGTPLIIDADGINLIAEHKLLDMLPKGTILTPHPKEFERLTGMAVSDRKGQLQKAEELAQRGLNVLLKGAYTILALSNGETWFNSTGNSSMAKGGMGDVLTGLLLGFLAQGYSPEETLKIGAFVHGDCGDKLFKEKGNYYSVSDFIEWIPETFKALK